MLSGRPRKSSISWAAGFVPPGARTSFRYCSAVALLRRPSDWNFVKRSSAITMDGSKTLAEGQVVEFEIKPGDKGLHAANVQRV